MRRTAVCLTVVASLVLVTGAWYAAPVKDAKKADPKVEVKADAGLAANLEKRFDFTGFDDARTTFKEALDTLADRQGVPFDVNEAAFKLEQINDVMAATIADPKPIPAQKNARLGEVLDRVLAKLPAQSGATYIVRRDAIEITTVQAQRAEIWGEGYSGPFLPIVHARFAKRPLDEALADLSEQAHFNIVVDKRAGDKATTAISARLTNAPLDTAVQLLAEMAELKVVHRDNVLFVTTPDQAAKMHKEFDKDRPKANRNLLGMYNPLFAGMLGGIGGLGGGMGGPVGFSPENEEPVPAYKWRKGSGHRVAPKNDGGAGAM